MTTYTTAYGKDITAFIDPKTAHVRIKFIQGGELPECLSGLFTSVRAAEKAILGYIEDDKPTETKKERQVKNKEV